MESRSPTLKPDGGALASALFRGFYPVWGTLVLGVPLLGILREAFRTQGTSRGVLDALLDPAILTVAGFTLLQALGSVALAFLLGVPAGLWLGRRLSAIPGWMISVLQFPMGMPSLAAISAALFWIGRNGVLTRIGFWPEAWLYSAWAVVVVHGVWNSSWVALRTLVARQAVPRERVEAARGLGAGPDQVLRHVLWPELRNEWLWTGLQVFQLCAMSFVVVQVLGGGPPVETLETAIYSRLRLAELDFPGAIACVLLQLLVTLGPGLLLLFKTLQEEDARGQSLGRVVRSGRISSFPVRRLPAAALVLALGLLPWVGLLRLDALAALGSIFRSPELWASIRASAGIALLSTLLAALQVYVLIRSVLLQKERERRFAISVALLPSGVSTLVLGFGLWLAFEFAFDPFADNLSWVILLQSVLSVPFLFRAFWPLASRPELRLQEAARALGAGRYQVFTAVEWPRWKPAVQGALGTLLMAGTGEVAALSLLSGGDWTGGVPLSVQVSRALSQYQFAQAQGWVLLLLGVGMVLALLPRVLAGVVDRGGGR